MDRRDFFKRLIITPLITPYLLASESLKGAFQLYVISDTPQLFFPSLLQGLKEYGLIPGQTYSFLNSHPKGSELKRALSHAGWNYLPKTSRIDFNFSFSHLRQKSSPSFTLIKSGKVWDIRSRKLSSLWKEMNSHHARSSGLTTVSFKEKKNRIKPGSFASIFIDGTEVERLRLKKNAVRSFRSEKGRITVDVQNGQAWVSDSFCHHKICLSHPPVSHAGERIICAPNNFLLEIQGFGIVDTVIG
jgi:hypothetical protein